MLAKCEGGVVYSAVFLGGIIPPKINLKQLPFTTVLMDSWDATQKLMAQIDQLEKIYYCALKCNSSVDDSGGTQPDQRLDELAWSAAEPEQAKRVKVRGFPRIQQRETVPGHCVYPQDGICRHQRLTAVIDWVSHTLVA
jgi:hypothetical protein